MGRPRKYLTIDDKLMAQRVAVEKYVEKIGKDVLAQSNKQRYQSDPDFKQKKIDSTKLRYQNDPVFRENFLRRQREAYHRKREKVMAPPNSPDSNINI